MKLGIMGCLAGSAAALLCSGCATDETSAQRSAYSSDTPTDSYRSAYASTTPAPVFVERRVVSINNTAREVPIYRTGDTYFYTYGGQRITLTDYPATVTRPVGTRVIRGPAYSSARFRDTGGAVVRTGYDEDDRSVRRTIIPADELNAGTTTYRTSRRV